MTDQTPLLADGLLGWPGFGPGGSQQFKVQRLKTGDIWYAPRSGFYFIAGCGGGGGGGATAAAGGGGGGGSGATLVLFPLYLPEGSGGVVTIGTGGLGSSSPGTGNNGTATSLGEALILGGGFGGDISGAGGETGAISGFAKTISGGLLKSQGANGESGGPSDAAGYGGSSFILESSLTEDIVSDFLSGRFRIAHGGRGKGTISGGVGAVGNRFGAGGGGGYASAGGNGADGCLIISWVGTI